MGLGIDTYRLQAERGLLIGREEGERVKDLLCRHLKGLPRMTVVRLDFREIRFVDVSGADEVVVRVLARILAGEFPDRFLTLSGVGVQHRENIEAALEAAKRAVIVVLSQSKWTVLGSINSALRRVLAFVGEHGAATAREVVDKLGIEPVNTASTRLAQLYQEGLVAREPWREPVRGGGRQFRYLALAAGKFAEELK